MHQKPTSLNNIQIDDNSQTLVGSPSTPSGSEATWEEDDLIVPLGSNDVLRLKPPRDGVVLKSPGSRALIHILQYI